MIRSSLTLSAVIVVAAVAIAGGPPPNDAFADAESASPLGGPVAGTVEGATLEPGERDTCDLLEQFDVHFGGTVWYDLVNVVPGRVRIQADRSESVVVVVVHAGPTLDLLDEVACGGGGQAALFQIPVAFDATPLTAYKIQVAAPPPEAFGVPAPFTLDVTTPLGELLPAP